MFKVGDSVVRINRNMPHTGVYVGDTYTVAHSDMRGNIGVITLVGLGSAVFYSSNFKLGQQSFRVNVSSLDYMNDDTLSIEDKQIITEALSND